MDVGQAMLEAVSLAAHTMPHPNPRVGALVLDTAGEPAGRGYHAAPGDPHAEVIALAEAGGRAAGGTVVVSLEPCCHAGRTPPCTEAILAAGVARVVVGSEDPDPRVSGSGIAALREAGIDVLVGVEEQAAVALDPGYFHHRRTGRPRVTLKAAATLDGQVAAADGTSKWITSEEARRDGHVLRSRSDAVMVGAGTVLSDDPRLDVRLEGSSGPQPRPVVVGGYRPLPRDAEVFRRGAVTFSPAEAALPGEVVVLPGPGGVDLWAAMEHLGNAGIVDLLVEGGPTLAVGLLNAGLVDRLVLYVAARIGGGTGRPVFDGVFATLADSFRVEMDSVDRLGPDLRIVCRVAGKG